MAEYIKREATLQIVDYAKQRTIEHIVREIGAYESLSNTCKAYYDSIITALDMCKQLIKEAVITADVQPVKRGRWIITDDVEHFIAICSECGRTEDSRDIKDMPYCHCGARMDGEQNDNSET